MFIRNISNFSWPHVDTVLANCRPGITTTIKLDNYILHKLIEWKICLSQYLIAWGVHAGAFTVIIFVILYMKVNNTFLHSSAFRKFRKTCNKKWNTHTHTRVVMRRWALSFDDADRREINHTCSSSVKCPNHNYSHYSYHVSSHFAPFTSISFQWVSIWPAYLNLSLGLYSICVSPEYPQGKCFQLRTVYFIYPW